MASRSASIHIDMDSPATLLRFWGLEAPFRQLDRFHEVAMTRALSLLRRCAVPATFFCVGEELEVSPMAAAMVRQAHDEGHEIANHTYSHPFGLTRLDPTTMRGEIADCSEAIRRVTGAVPAGFRAPGYAIDAAVLDVLEQLGFDYDSSASWSVLRPAMKLYRRVVSGRSGPESFGEASRRLPRGPYYPARDEWTRQGPTRPIVEIPLPRTRLLGLPFYSTFHLGAGALYRNTATALMRQSHVVYLVHLVEFVDLDDGLPAALRIHPGVGTAAAVKRRALERTIANLQRRYRIVRTTDLVRAFRGAAAPRSTGMGRALTRTE